MLLSIDMIILNELNMTFATSYSKKYQRFIEPKNRKEGTFENTYLYVWLTCTWGLHHNDPIIRDNWDIVIIDSVFIIYNLLLLLRKLFSEIPGNSREIIAFLENHRFPGNKYLQEIIRPNCYNRYYKL